MKTRGRETLFRRRKPYAVKVKFTVNDEDSTRVVRIYTLKAWNALQAAQIIETRCKAQMDCIVTFVKAYPVTQTPLEIHVQETH